jgi:hypothetical protein
VLVGPAGELGPWRFAHDLFREVLYDQLDPPERIRYSVARIARAHPELAAHLEASVTTGSSCAYVAAEPVTWLT